MLPSFTASCPLLQFLEQSVVYAPSATPAFQVVEMKGEAGEMMTKADAW